MLVNYFEVGLATRCQALKMLSQALIQALSLFFVLLTILIYIVETTDEVDEHQFIFRVIESISVAFFTMELFLTILAR